MYGLRDRGDTQYKQAMDFVNDSSDASTEPQSEGKRLRGLLEAGKLPRARLVLAGALGHAASRHALGNSDREAVEESQVDSELSGAGDASLQFWGRRLARFGPQVMLRTALGVARQLAIRAQPSEALRGGVELCDRFVDPNRESPKGPELEVSAKAVARAALDLPEEGPPRQACMTLLPLLRALIDIQGGGVFDRMVLNAHFLRVLEYASASEVADATLQEAVREELLSWALTP